MQAVQAFWAKSLLNKLTIVGLVGIVCCCPIGLAGRGQRTAQAPASVAQVETVDETSTPAPPTATEGPTSTPAPTKTPAPTNTPKPTSTPAPTATPVPPVTIEGSGQSVTDPFTAPASINLVTFTHQGRSNFIVKAYTSDGSDQTLVNVIGSYQGIRPLIAEGEIFFEIDADGPWTARVESLSFDETVAQGAAGRGDWASGLFTPIRSGVVPFEVSHDGESNFIVYVHCAGGSENVQNEIGAVGGSTVVRFSEGPCLWEVQADGNWSLTARQ